MTELCEVVITAPDPEWLKDFSRKLVEQGLCASAHNFTPVRSVYRWHGDIHERTEGRVSLHTRQDRVAAIVALAKREHPYEVPGISARPITDGNPDYLAWIEQETAPELSPPEDQARRGELTAVDRFAEQLRAAFPADAITQVQVLGHGDDPEVKPNKTAFQVFFEWAGRTEGKKANPKTVHEFVTANGTVLNKLRGELPSFIGWVEFRPAGLSGTGRHDGRAFTIGDRPPPAD